MHNLTASFVLGYHGCDRDAGEKLLQNEQFRPSENSYDWLGSGIYFWEANPDRALDWAIQRTASKKSKDDIQAGGVLISLSAFPRRLKPRKSTAFTARLKPCPFIAMAN